MLHITGFWIRNDSLCQRDSASNAAYAQCVRESVCSLLSGCVCAYVCEGEGDGACICACVCLLVVVLCYVKPFREVI